MANFSVFFLLNILETKIPKFEVEYFTYSINGCG